jgi:hypothetical protein
VRGDILNGKWAGQSRSSVRSGKIQDVHMDSIDMGSSQYTCPDLVELFFPRGALKDIIASRKKHSAVSLTSVARTGHMGLPLPVELTGSS